MEEAGKKRITGADGINYFVSLNGIIVNPEILRLIIKHKSLTALSEYYDLGSVCICHSVYEIIRIFRQSIITEIQDFGGV